MTIEIGCVLLILGFHQESYFNMFESDNKMKIYLCWLLLENTLSHFSLLLNLLQNLGIAKKKGRGNLAHAKIFDGLYKSVQRQI